MQELRTLEEIFATEGAEIIWAIAAHPAWEHYDPDHCPRPIKDWLEAHSPATTVERVQLRGCGICDWGDETSDFETSDQLPQPIFRLGFQSEAEADAFTLAWSDPARQAADGKDFYFIEATSETKPRPASQIEKTAGAQLGSAA